MKIGKVVDRRCGAKLGGKRLCQVRMAPKQKDHHPTCAKCRGKYCFPDDNCDVCRHWDKEIWHDYDPMVVPDDSTNTNPISETLGPQSITQSSSLALNQAISMHASPVSLVTAQAKPSSWFSPLLA